MNLLVSGVGTGAVGSVGVSAVVEDFLAEAAGVDSGIAGIGVSAASCVGRTRSTVETGTAGTGSPQATVAVTRVSTVRHVPSSGILIVQDSVLVERQGG